VPQVLQLVSACPQVWAAAVDVTAADANLGQLYQVHLWLLDSRLPAPGQGLLGVLSQQQLQQCKDSWEQSLTESTSSAKASNLQRSVFAALQALCSTCCLSCRQNSRRQHVALAVLPAENHIHPWATP
jgi:porphobilinogen deaminase